MGNQFDTCQTISNANGKKGDSQRAFDAMPVPRPEPQDGAAAKEAEARRCFEELVGSMCGALQEALDRLEVSGDGRSDRGRLVQILREELGHTNYAQKVDCLIELLLVAREDSFSRIFSDERWATEQDAVQRMRKELGCTNVELVEHIFKLVDADGGHGISKKPFKSIWAGLPAKGARTHGESAPGSMACSNTGRRPYVSKAFQGRRVSFASSALQLVRA